MPHTCDATATVAYAFLVRESIPLWDVWVDYWKDCGDAVVPVAHSQAQGSVREELEAKLNTYGGRLVPTENTLQGNPRWKWEMVQMMFALYRTAGEVKATNGCPPKWIHLVSESCAPVRKCSKVHSRLAQRPGSSHLTFMQDPQGHGPWTGNEIPEELRPAAHTSQWITLATTHALALAAAEEELRLKWKPHLEHAEAPLVNYLDIGGHGRIFGASEEWIFYTELTQRSMPFDTNGLSAAWICCHGESHPNEANDRDGTVDLCHRAQSEGFDFVRKLNVDVGHVGDVMSGIRYCIETPLQTFTTCTKFECSSPGNDCCAPREIGESATCRGDDYTPVRWVERCGGDSPFHEGEYRCCK